MKKLSMKGLADYMVASSTRQRSILREYKYPQEDSAQARIFYYREARDRINAFHGGAGDLSWLRGETKSLDLLAKSHTEPTSTRFEHNAVVLRAYTKYFASRKFEVLTPLTVQLQFADVLISVYPDMHVRENKKEKIVKLEFGKNRPSNDGIKIISQIMFEAAQQENMGLTSACVLYLDVRRGEEHRGARLGSRMQRNIEATCENISAIWDTI